MNRRLLTAASMITLLFTLSAELSAQNQRNFTSAQSRIRERIVREQGVNNARVTFNDDGRFDSESNNRVRVRGTGTYYRGQYDNGRNFGYDAVYDIRNGDIRELNYRFYGGSQPGTGNPGPFPPGTGGGGGVGRGWGGNRPNGSVTYSGQIANSNSNKCLDISDYGNSSDGTRIQQWSCAGQPNQVFDLISVGQNEYAVYNRQTRKVFDIPDNQVSQDGAELQQFRWSGRANQRFRLVQSGGGGFQLVNVASGKCLDVDSQSNDDGARIHQWNCRGQRSQIFRMQNF